MTSMVGVKTPTILQFIWLSVVKMIVKHCRRTSRNLEFGKRIWKWILTQENARSCTSPVLETPSNTHILFMVKSFGRLIMPNILYIGLEISSDLTGNTDIENVTTRTLGFIRTNIRTKHQGIREIAHNTLVRPQIEYASPVWSPYTQSIIHKVEKIQRAAI